MGGCLAQDLQIAPRLVGSPCSLPSKTLGTGSGVHRGMQRCMCSADRTVLVAVTCAVVSMVAGCGSSGSSTPNGMTAGQVQDYLAQVEPVRRSVNDLLEGADPILHAYRSHQITPDQAARRMNDLEARFAVQGATVEAISSPDPPSRRSTAPTRTPTNSKTPTCGPWPPRSPTATSPICPTRRMPNARQSPHGESELEVLAQQTGATLPDDLQQAGRGEIAPSPTGS